MKGVNDKSGTPNYDMYQKALRSTAQRLYPNYCNACWNTNNRYVNLDREIKNAVLNELTDDEYNKLVEFGKNNPDAFKKLGLQINDEDNQISQ